MAAPDLFRTARQRKWILSHDIYRNERCGDPRALVADVAKVANDVPNDLIVRGYTDALTYARNGAMNNWRLSTARADATRQALALAGVGSGRFARIEGVADREPFNPANRFDPKSRRMSITLAWSGTGR